MPRKLGHRVQESEVPLENSEFESLHFRHLGLELATV